MPVIVGTSTTGPVTLDVQVLLRSQLLLQANSGGGKSWALRRLAEQIAGEHVQTFIVDPEGEFSTLREHFPFVLVGPGGETPADPATAPAVAHKLLELGVSAVFDLFEMKTTARHAWVAAFFDALVDAPKRLWRPLVVMLDEAHIYAPERGSGDSVASDSVAALASRGRKRGYCLAAATQRLGKLRKDVAAELQNILVGPTFMDIDRDRAAEALGIPRADRKAFDQQVKTMEPGNFFALGRAISKDRIQVRIGPVTSSHPEPGSAKHAAAPPPPPEQIRKLLATLGDLPKEVARKKATEEELRAEVARLRAELATAPGRHEMVGKLAEDATRLAADVESWKRDSERFEQQLKEMSAAFDGATPNEVRRLRTMETFFERVIEVVDGYREAGAGKYAAVSFAAPAAAPAPWRRDLGQRALPYQADIPTPDPTPRKPAATGDIGRAGRLILTALASRHPAPLTKVQVATLAGYAPNGGGFNNAIGDLKGKGLIERDGDSFAITAAGLRAAPAGERPKTPAELLALWCSKLPGRSRDMLTLLARSRRPLTKEEIAKDVGMDPTGGGFNNYMGALRSNALIQKTRGGFEAAASLVLR